MARILHIVGDSKYGGGGVLIERLATEAARHGHAVAVLTTDSVVQQKLRDAGVGTVDLDCIWRPIRPLRDLRGLYRLWRYLRRNRYDLVHTHTSKAGFVGRVAARLAGVPVVVHTVHGFAFHEQSSKASLRIYSLLERIAARFCDALVTVSCFHRDWAATLGIGTEKTRIAIPNGINPARVLPVKDRNAVRASLGMAASDLLCLTTGRLARQKGLDVLFHAVSDLKNIPSMQVMIAGEGEEREKLEYLAKTLDIESKVHFLGFRTDLGDLLAVADIVVLPSLWEGLSISLLEAMAAGKAIITTDIGSNLEVTQSGKSALIVKAGDVPSLADGLNTLLSSPELREQLGKAAQERFAQEYREDLMLRRYMEVYQRLLPQNRTP
jgi:glycosyltransferase involved in cell wall biosynthesis